MLTMAQLVEETGYPERTIRNYVQRGVIPPEDETVGPGGYGPLHVDLLLAITRLNQQGVRRHDDLRARLQAMSREELARFADTGDQRPAAHPEPATPQRAVVAAPAPPPSLEPQGAHAREAWERIVLAPGLELHVRRDAGPEARRMAEDIAARRQGG